MMRACLEIQIHVRDVFTHRSDRLSGSRLFARLSEASPARRASCRSGFRLWCPASCPSSRVTPLSRRLTSEGSLWHPPIPRHAPSEMTRDAGDNRLAFASRRPEISPSKWKPALGKSSSSRHS